MGYYINIISRHRLKTENVESLTKNLSEALDINIKYGYSHEYVINIKKRVIEEVRDYQRISLGKIIRGIGADYVYFHPDQGTPEIICDQLHLCGEKMEEYILIRTYIKDSCYISNDKLEYCKSEIMDIPSFMLAEKKIFSERYEDIFRDDFSDID